MKCTHLGKPLNNGAPSLLTVHGWAFIINICVQIHSFFYVPRTFELASRRIVSWFASGAAEASLFSYSTAHTYTATHIIYPAAFVPHYGCVCGEEERGHYPGRGTERSLPKKLRCRHTLKLSFFSLRLSVCISVWRAYYFLHSRAGSARLQHLKTEHIANWCKRVK